MATSRPGPGLLLERMAAALARAAAVACLLLAPAASAQDEPTDPIAIPKVARVVDQTGALTPADIQALNAKLAAFEQAKGSQIAVLMVPTIGQETIEEFAGRVTDAWALGRKGVDDGVLFVVAKQQRKMRIHTGRGVQGTLTDAASKRIVAERVAPAFRNGDFAGGVNAAVDTIMKAIEGEALPPPAATKRAKVGVASSIENFLWIAFLAVPIVAMALRSMVGRLAGAGLTSGITGIAAWLIFGSLAVGLVAIVVAFLFSLFIGSDALRQARGGTIGGWGGGGGWTGGGGGWTSGGGGFSGGGGGFDGGGASGDW